MQLTLKFKGNGIVLPIAHKYHVQAMIYSMLSTDESFSRFFHDEGFAFGEKNFKFFTFGNLYGKYSVENKSISFPEGFVLQIRSPISEFINAILRTLVNRREFVLCGNIIRLYDFSIDSRTVAQSEITVKTLSPITVHTTVQDGKTRYYSPLEDEFYDLVYQNAENKLACSQIQASVPLKMTLLGTCGEKNKTVTRYKDNIITAWSGKFRLHATPEILTFLYDTGLGSKNAQGFGMFELIQGE